MPTLSVEEKRLRARLVAWLRYFRAYYDAEDGTDTAFARRIGWSKSAISEYFTGARHGPGLDILPLLRERLHADLNKIIARDPTQEELDSARSAAARDTVPGHGRRKTASGD